MGAFPAGGAWLAGWQRAWTSRRCWMTRMSAPPSNMWVAQLWRRRWQPPGRPMRACLRVWQTMRPRTSRLKRNNAAEDIPRGNIRGGRDPLAGGTRTRCSISPRTSHYPAQVTWPRRRAAHVTARSGMYQGAERRSFGERVLPVARRQITDWKTQQRFSRRGPDLACESHL